MDESEQRQIARDSLFVMAEMRLDESSEQFRIKVRNLSSGGLIGKGTVRVLRGGQVWINLRNMGWGEGTVAESRDNRFGVAFREEIDPKVARATMSGGEDDKMLVRPPPQGHLQGGVLRKV